MSLSFLLMALFAVSVLTSLTVEAIKKIKEGPKSSNITAAIVAMILSIGTSVVYHLYCSIAISAKTVAETLVLTFLSFLCATVGYDKVVQAIKQIASKKEGK